MAETSGFFASVNGDRTYNTSFLARWIASIIGNGVYNGELSVSAVGGEMAVTLPIGRAWINGYHYRNDTVKALTIANADGILRRKDTIVLRWDVNERSISVHVLQGTFASTPVAPKIIRTAEQYDLKLAEINIPAGATAITQAMIIDTRLDNSVCGIVTGVVEQIDTTTFYNQIAADLAYFKSSKQSDFEVWVEGLKDILDENTAGNLLQLIYSVSDEMRRGINRSTGNIPLSLEGGDAAMEVGMSVKFNEFAEVIATDGDDGTGIISMETLGGKLEFVAKNIL
ncbi:hypothetical protein [Clostridium merdae]|uniref:hypothetical protein n=1 Tax=Clostridium merdae TaxID=1958780 RepID=UPI000A26EB65|nr:hypothetical protein [Clostridium merdae]